MAMHLDRKNISKKAVVILASVLFGLVSLTACDDSDRAYTTADCKTRLAKDYRHATDDPTWEPSGGKPKECGNLSTDRVSRLALDVVAAQMDTRADCKARLTEDFDRAMDDPDWNGEAASPAVCGDLSQAQFDQLVDEVSSEGLNARLG